LVVGLAHADKYAPAPIGIKAISPTHIKLIESGDYGQRLFVDANDLAIDEVANLEMPGPPIDPLQTD
jgi:hypothetical protein